MFEQLTSDGEKNKTFKDVMGKRGVLKNLSSHTVKNILEAEMTDRLKHNNRSHVRTTNENIGNGIKSKIVQNTGTIVSGGSSYKNKESKQIVNKKYWWRLGNIKEKIQRNWKIVLRTLTLLVDLGGTVLSGVAAYHLRNLLPYVPHIKQQIFILHGALFCAVLFIVSLLLGMYRTMWRTTAGRQKRVALKSYFWSIFIVFSLLYLFQLGQFPRRFTILFFLLVPPVFAFGRYIIYHFNLAMQKHGYGKCNTLVVATENSRRDLFKRFDYFPELGYKVKGFVLKNNGTMFIKPLVKEMEYSEAALFREAPSQFKNIRKYIDDEKIGGIFIPSERLITNGYADILKMCREKNVNLKILSPETEHVLRLANMDEITGISLYNSERWRINFFQRIIKRTFDITISALMIIISLPLMICTALAIILDSGTPVFFRQKRAGLKGGKTFVVYKFRTMVRNADVQKKALEGANESQEALFKIRKDPRITRVGKILRRFSLDELPQLFNVLKGDMRLVGPRPLPIEDFDQVEESDRYWDAMRARGYVKPGLTGLWQISGRSDIGFTGMILLDLYYVENQSIFLDIGILLGTIPVVLFGRGAY